MKETIHTHYTSMLNKSPNVQNVGYIDNIFLRYLSDNLFVVFSYVENYGFNLIEACDARGMDWKKLSPEDLEILIYEEMLWIKHR